MYKPILIIIPSTNIYLFCLNIVKEHNRIMINLSVVIIILMIHFIKCGLILAMKLYCEIWNVFTHILCSFYMTPVKINFVSNETHIPKNVQFEPLIVTYFNEIFIIYFSYTLTQITLTKDIKKRNIVFKGVILNFQNVSDYINIFPASLCLYIILYYSYL